MFILLNKKEIPSLSCAKNTWTEFFSLFSVPTTMPTSSPSPEGKIGNIHQTITDRIDDNNDDDDYDDDDDDDDDD